MTQTNGTDGFIVPPIPPAPGSGAATPTPQATEIGRAHV